MYNSNRRRPRHVAIPYFRGLCGHLHKYGQPDSAASNLAALHSSAARYHNVFVENVEYQTAARPTPWVSDMGKITTDSLWRMQSQYDAILLVASSVGVGALLEGIGQYLDRGGRAPIGMVLIGGVYDPVSAVELMVQAGTLQADKNGAVDVPVTIAAGQAPEGHFTMSKQAMADPAVVRLLHKPGNNPLAKKTIDAIRQAKIPVAIMVAEDDAVSRDARRNPVELARAVLKMFGAEVEIGGNLEVWPSGHNERSDQRLDDVSHKVEFMLHGYASENCAERPARTVPPAKLPRPQFGNRSDW